MLLDSEDESCDLLSHSDLRRFKTKALQNSLVEAEGMVLQLKQQIQDEREKHRAEKISLYSLIRKSNESY